MSSTLSIQRWTFFIPPIFTSIEQLNLSLAHCFAEHNLPYTQSRLSPVLNRLCRRCCHLPNGGFFWTYSPENSREKYIPPCPLDFWSPHKPLYHLCSSLSFAWYTAELKSAWYADTAFKDNTHCAASVSKPNAPPAPKYIYPSSISRSKVFFNRWESSGMLSGGIFLCPVKQAVFPLIKVHQPVQSLKAQKI